MEFGDNLTPGVLLQRVNRFLARVEIAGKVTPVHVANSGRLRELMQTGFTVYVKPIHRPGAKTQHDLALVQLDRVLVSADARVPNQVVAEALSEGALPEFDAYRAFDREHTFGHHRIDFLLSNGQSPCLLEVKSITLVVEDGLGLFPDAPTLRGASHLQALIEAKRLGYRAAIIFVIQREDADRFSPNDAADPNFGRWLRQAAAAGVDIYAYRCRVDLRAIELAQRVPVLLPALPVV
ncbi:MAG: DNA/RNA nuclease SfsA [Chloroflexi bacterium]|nr:DNA/RNA nuclease SfsA [Chloroflexota bacterium]